MKTENKLNESEIVPKNGTYLCNVSNVSLQMEVYWKEATQEQPAGFYEVEFNPVSCIEHQASGVYFYQLRSGSFIQTRKMVLLR